MPWMIVVRLNILENVMKSCRDNRIQSDIIESLLALLQIHVFLFISSTKINFFEYFPRILFCCVWKERERESRQVAWKCVKMWHFDIQTWNKLTSQQLYFIYGNCAHIFIALCTRYNFAECVDAVHLWDMLCTFHSRTAADCTYRYSIAFDAKTILHVLSLLFLVFFVIDENSTC